MKTEAAIIGAGPAGLIAAIELARGGFKTTVYEEHNTVGEPNHCAGLISLEGFKRLGIKPQKDFIQQEIIGGKLYSPSTTGIRITSNRSRAFVVDRCAFDRYLMEIALEEGAKLITNCRIKRLIVKGGVPSIINGGETKVRLVIDAEGVKSIISGSLGFPKPKGIISGINAEVSGVELEKGMVEVWFGSKYSPGFFVWVIPNGDGTARCGLGCNSGDPWVRLREFLDNRFKDYDAKNPARWPIILGGPINRTFGESILLVGDVAGQVKSTTAGGVIMGGLCALKAAKTAASALELGNTSADYLQNYDKEWRAEYGKEFNTMLQARRLANKISDVRIDRFFDAVKKAGLEETAEGLINEGDMDMQGDIIRRAITNPRFIRVSINTLGRVIFKDVLDLLK